MQNEDKNIKMFSKFMKISYEINFIAYHAIMSTNGVFMHWYQFPLIY